MTKGIRTNVSKRLSLSHCNVPIPVFFPPLNCVWQAYGTRATRLSRTGSPSGRGAQCHAGGGGWRSLGSGWCIDWWQQRRQNGIGFIYHVLNVYHVSYIMYLKTFDLHYMVTKTTNNRQQVMHFTDVDNWVIVPFLKGNLKGEYWRGCSNHL